MHSSVEIIDNESVFSGKNDQLLNLYTFFMACPIIVIFQNISVYILLLLLVSLSSQKRLFLRFSTLTQKVAVFFGLGAILSTLGSFSVGGKDSLQNSLIVLPNYLYWAFLIVLLITYRNCLKLDRLFKALTIGLFVSIIYFFFIQRQPLIREIGIFKGLSQNAFAFLMICYTPIAVFYLKSRAKPILVIVAIIVLSLIGFISGSRSGSILVLTGALLSFFISDNFSKRRVLIITVFGILSLLFFTSAFAERLIYSLNPRTYNLLYATNTTLAHDQSFLVRQAMIEKGIGLFKDHPITGIGLNNFSATKGIIQGAFKGSERVIHKNLDTGKSAHNSYIGLLSEGGLVVIIPYLLMIFLILRHFVLHFRTIPAPYKAVFIGILMMTIHLYFISAILNVFAWFLIGLASALVYRDEEQVLSPDV